MREGNPISSRYRLSPFLAAIQPIFIDDVLSVREVQQGELHRKVVVEICLDIFSSKWTLLKNAMMMDAKEHSKTSAKWFSPIIGDVEEVEIKESAANKINKWRNKNLK